MSIIKFFLPALFADFFILSFGGKSSSSSSTSTTNNSFAADNRQALGEGAIGASGDGSVTLTDNSSTTLNSIDPGALRAMELAITANSVVSQSAIDAASSSAAAAAAAASQASADALKSNNTSQRMAFDFASNADALNAEGFQSLLSSGMGLLTKAFDSTQKTQQFTADAYQTASAELSGSLDNKTIMILGLGGIAAVALFAFKKKG